MPLILATNCVYQNDESDDPASRGDGHPMSAEDQVKGWNVNWQRIKNASWLRMADGDDTNGDEGGNSARRPRGTGNPYVIIVKLSNFYL